MMLSANLKFILDRRGQEATLTKRTYGAYNPLTGTNNSSETDYTVKMYFAEYTLSEIDNQSVIMGDRKVLVSPVDTSGSATPEPDQEDIISGVGDTLVIVSVQKIYNASTLVCYICQARE